jgi:hypothetical protein
MARVCKQKIILRVKYVINNILKAPMGVEARRASHEPV